MKKLLSVLVIFAFSTTTLLADPATRDKTKRGAAIGAVAGGVLGAVLGNNTGSGNAKRGAVIGTVAGTAIGAGIGVYMDKQERELRQIEGIEVQRTADDELNVVVKNEVLFAYNSAALQSASRGALQEMASVFDRYNSTRIAVEGHADSTGSESYNYRLSQRRANSVASYLEGMGVDGYRLDAEALGESQPRASNSTERGRRLNRRVEIKIKADRS